MMGPPSYQEILCKINSQLNGDSQVNLQDLEKLIVDINNTELLCKKNPQLSKVIFFNFFSKICKKANSYS